MLTPSVETDEQLKPANKEQSEATISLQVSCPSTAHFKSIDERYQSIFEKQIEVNLPSERNNNSIIRPNTERRSRKESESLRTGISSNRKQNNDPIIFQQYAQEKENFQTKSPPAKKKGVHKKKQVLIKPFFDSSAPYKFLLDNELQYHFSRTIIQEQIHSNKISVQFIIYLKINEVRWVLARTLTQFKALHEYFGINCKSPMDESTAKDFFQRMVQSPTLRNTKVFQKFINLNKHKDQFTF